MFVRSGVNRMRNEQAIRERLAATNSAVEIELLMWVLDTPDCPLCGLGNRREIEVSIHSGEHTVGYYDERYSWTIGTAQTHMDEHVDYDPEEAAHMESLRYESINTLDAAQDIVSRLLGWIDELESVKDSQGGITSEWVADASRLVAQANTSLRLVGQLKKEIGVDSQLLLAQKQMDGVMAVLVDSLRDNPALLDTVEARLGAMALNSPRTIEADWEVDD